MLARTSLTPTSEDRVNAVSSDGPVIRLVSWTRELVRYLSPSLPTRILRTVARFRARTSSKGRRAALVQPARPRARAVLVQPVLPQTREEHPLSKKSTTG